MLRRFATLSSGVVAVVAGFAIMALFGTNDPYYLQAQLGLGGLSIAVGLYLVIAGTFGSSATEQQGPPRLSTLMRRDVRGRVVRSIAIGLAIAVVVGAIFATMLLTSGAAYSVGSTRNKLGADVLVLPTGSSISSQPFYTLVYTPGSTYMDENLVGTVAKMPGVSQVSPQLYLTSFAPSGGCGGLDKVYLLAVDPASNFMLRSWIPSNVSQLLEGHSAIIGAEVPPAYTFPSGSTFYGVNLKIQGRLPLTGTFMDHVIFVSFSTANAMLKWQLITELTDVGQSNQQAPAQSSSTLIHTHVLNYWLQPLTFQPGQISAMFVKLDDGTKAPAMAGQVQSSILNVHAYTFDSLVQSANVRFSGLLSTFSISGSLVWVGAVVMVAATTSIGINERRAEIGLIRAMGGTRGFVRKLIATETIIITSIAGVIGVFATWVIFFTQWTTIILAVGLPYITPPPVQLGILTLFAVSIAIVTGSLAALWPARLASRMEPYEATRATTG